MTRTPHRRSRTAGPRADALPEFFRYRDDGCSVAPKCEACPLPVCRYELHGGLRSVLHIARDAEIVAAAAAREALSDIAARFGVSRRTVYRVLNVAEGWAT